MTNASRKKLTINLTRFKRIWALSIVVILISSVATTPSRAIQGGESAKGIGFVVAMVIPISESNGTLCSGGLVAPKIIATAAHCIVKRGVLAKFESILIFPPGSDLAAPSNVKIKKAFVPEGYQNASDIGEPGDIAFLVLDKPLGKITIEAIATQSMVEKIIKSGTEIRLYGYGITGLGQSAAGFPKTLVLKPIEKVSLQGFEGKENTYVNYAQEASGAACNGDSGGPAVANFEGRLTLVSLHSSSSGVCSETSGIPSNWGTIPGEYTSLYALALKAAAEPVDSVSPTASPQPSATPSATTTPKKKTITCIKGKIIKKIIGVNPKCPKGYTRKK